MLRFVFMVSVYILYSLRLDVFYIGSTSDDLEQRIRRHLSEHSGFTSRAKDWVLVYKETFEDKKKALTRERQIKNWKSKIRVRQLINSAK